MTYHDNHASFSLSKGYTLLSGSYLIDSLSVTPGQDPEKYLYPGLKLHCGSDGIFTFKAGLSLSKDVAGWFNENVPAAQTTFDHKAGELYFAFTGTLKLTITGGSLPGIGETFSFSGVALALGHIHSSNNWWFGGKSCSNIGGNKVTCAGVNTKDAPVSFTFLRGGNGPAIDVTPPSL